MSTTTVATHRLLLVDDDEAACRLLAEVLERESYEVVRALSVDEAVAKFHREGPFDAVLTDLRMPGASGLDLLQHVREADPEAHDRSSSRNRDQAMAWVGLALFALD